MTGTAASSQRAPVVLIACSTAWDFPARVAMAFAELGWQVEAVCGRGQRLQHARVVRRVHRYRALWPLNALGRAIHRAVPDLVVRCDDRALRHLAALQGRLRKAGRHGQADMLVRSLGDFQASPMPGRAALIAMAREDGVAAPQTLRIARQADLPAALERIGLPCVLKVDGTWGGSGVAIATTAAHAAALFQRMSRPLTLAQAVKRLVVNRDPFWLETWFGNSQPQLNVQAFVAGKPANCAVACHAGEVLAIVQMAVERTQRDMGPSAIVRVIDRPEIAEAARRIVRRLRLSGFIGLDFMIDAATGVPQLIEMNQRMTPTAHLALTSGQDPVGALTARWFGGRSPSRPPTTGKALIALFPAAWQGEPHDDLLGVAYHDIPWADPALARQLAQPAWQHRGWLLRLDLWLRGARSGLPRPAAFPPALARLLEGAVPEPIAANAGAGTGVTMEVAG